MVRIEVEIKVLQSHDSVSLLSSAASTVILHKADQLVDKALLVDELLELELELPPPPGAFLGFFASGSLALALAFSTATVGSSAVRFFDLPPPAEEGILTLVQFFFYVN